MLVQDLLDILRLWQSAARVVVYHDGHNYDLDALWLDRSKLAEQSFGDAVVAIQLREIEEEEEG